MHGKKLIKDSKAQKISDIFIRTFLQIKKGRISIDKPFDFMYFNVPEIKQSIFDLLTKLLLFCTYYLALVVLVAFYKF